MLDRWRHNCVEQTIWKQMNSRASILLVSVGCILFARSLVAQMETFVPANDVSFSFQLNAKATGLENKSICIVSRTSATVRCVLEENGRRNAPETVTFGCGLRTAPGNTSCQAMGFLRPRRQSESRYRAHDARSRLAQTR